MHKDYKGWTPVKIRVNNDRKRPKKYHEGGVYWAYLGENVGVEQDGQGKGFSRPVLILKGYSSELVHCLPISHTKKNNKLFYRIKFVQIDGSALLSQLRPIDTLRLSTLITDIPNEMLADIKRAVANLILS